MSRLGRGDDLVEDQDDELARRPGDQLGGSPPAGRRKIVITYAELHRLLALPEGTEVVDAATFPSPHKGILHVVYQPVTQ